MGLNTDKLVFKKQFREAGVIMVQSETGTAKMYPSNKDNIIEGIKRGRNLGKLKDFFTPESIADAYKEVSTSKDSSANEDKPKKDASGKK